MLQSSFQFFIHKYALSKPTNVYLLVTNTVNNFVDVPPISAVAFTPTKTVDHQRFDAASSLIDSNENATKPISPMVWFASSEGQLQCELPATYVWNKLNSPGFPHLLSDLYSNDSKHNSSMYYQNSQAQVPSQTSFVYNVKEISFFKLNLSPVLHYDVFSNTSSSTINMTVVRAEIINKATGKPLTDHFTIQSQSIINVEEDPDTNTGIIRIRLQIKISVPTELGSAKTLIPNKLILSAGNYLLQNFANSALYSSLISLRGHLNKYRKQTNFDI